MEFPEFKNDRYDKVVDIVIYEPTKDENTGNYSDGESVLVENLKCNIQTLSGAEVVSQSGTKFESDHLLFSDPVSVEIPQGAEVREKAGEVILKKYKVVLPLPGECSLEMEMKKL